MTAAATLKRTPFYERHVALGAKIVPFAGYEMPVQYAQGITAEHKAVRERCGLFDVSHMGEFIVRGARAVEFVNYVTTNDVAALDDRPGPLLHDPQRPRNDRGRLPRVSLRRPRDDGRERVERREGLCAHRASRRRLRRHDRGRQRRHGSARAAGTDGREDPAAADAHRSLDRSATTTSRKAASPACR